MKCRYVKISTIVHSTESLDTVIEVLRNFFGEIPIVVEMQRGHYGNEIYLLTSLVENCDSVLEKLCASLSGADLKPAEDGVYYIRLDKQQLVRAIARVTNHDDVVRLKVRVEDNLC